MIDWLNKRYVILSASHYKEKFERGQLRNIDIRLTFDDALKCQYDIAVPTMERLGIEASLSIATLSVKTLIHWKSTDISELHAMLKLTNFTRDSFI